MSVHLRSDMNDRLWFLRQSPFSLDISESTKCIAVKFYRTSVYHYEAFTCKI